MFWLVQGSFSQTAPIELVSSFRLDWVRASADRCLPSSSPSRLVVGIFKRNQLNICRGNLSSFFPASAIICISKKIFREIPCSSRAVTTQPHNPNLTRTCHHLLSLNKHRATFFWLPPVPILCVPREKNVNTGDRTALSSWTNPLRNCLSSSH